MQPDNELLHQYATGKSEEAFTELVKRHVNLVYSAALRQAGGDAHLAHDVTQNVFTDLAQKAASLSRRKSLTGWLYTSAYFAANKMVRTEVRRREREEKFMREPVHESPEQTDWEKLRPLLDAAMHGLKESDREAILLRYFENRSYAEVGAKFGLNENAARLRVERALEKLRVLLAKRGLAAGTTLASTLSANAIQTAPDSLTTYLARASQMGVVTRRPSLPSTILRLGLGTLAAVSIMTALVAHHYSQMPSLAKIDAAPQPLAAAANRDLESPNPAAEAAPDLQNPSSEQQASLTQSNSNSSPGAAASATNAAYGALVDRVSLVARVAVVPTDQMPGLSSGWAPAGNGASILSAEQYGKIDESLLGAGSLQLRSLTIIMTAYGFPAESGVAQPVTIDGTNANIAVILGVTPSFDSSLFTLNAAVQFSPLYGDPSQPGMQSLQISNQVHLFSDQSAVLETDIPPGGWLDNALSLPEGKHKLLVFLKPAILPGKTIWKIHFYHVRLDSLTQGPAPFE
jgi:RNA polymerase sigma factor (sigma-70 family)